MSGLKVITPPTGEQISLTEARLHLRLDDDGDSPAAHPDDGWLSGVGIPGAREYCEQWLRRALAPQTLELALDAFPTLDIVLPMAPITALDSVRYLDANSAWQTLSATLYTFDDYDEPCVIRRLETTTWPVTKVVPNAVRVRFDAGYTLPNDSPDTAPLPYAIRAAMLLVLGALYENRESGGEVAKMPAGVQALLEPYRLRLSMA